MAISPPNTMRNITSNIACALLVIIMQYYFIHLKNIFKFTIFFCALICQKKKRSYYVQRETQYNCGVHDNNNGKIVCLWRSSGTETKRRKKRQAAAIPESSCFPSLVFSDLWPYRLFVIAVRVHPVVRCSTRRFAATIAAFHRNELEACENFPTTRTIVRHDFSIANAKMMKFPFCLYCGSALR